MPDLFINSSFQNNRESTYLEFLNQEEWKAVRKNILRRDEYKCKRCNASYRETIWNLHVHHTYYINGRLPWEYEECCLETLCYNCHTKLHHETTVSVFVEVRGELIKKEDLIPCYRCGSAGYLPHYKHVENGICFRCRGLQFENFIVSEFKMKNIYTGVKSTNCNN